MDFDILCESLKELYGNNNDYGLFRENMTDAEKSNLLSNFDGGAAFFNLKGWVPFSGYDLFTTSDGAFRDILKEMKPWKTLSYEQKKRVVDFSSKQWALNTDESRYVAAYVLYNGVKCQQYHELAKKYSDDGYPYDPRPSWGGRKYTEEDAAAAKQAFDEFKESFQNQSPKALDGTDPQNMSGESQIHVLTSNGFEKVPQSFVEDPNEKNEDSNAAPKNKETDNEKDKPVEKGEDKKETVDNKQILEDAERFLKSRGDDKADSKSQTKSPKEKKKITTVEVDPKKKVNQPQSTPIQPQTAQTQFNPDANEVPLLNAQRYSTGSNDENDKGWFARNWELLTAALAAIAVASISFFLVRKQKKKTKKANENAETLRKTVADLETKVGMLSDEIAKKQAASNNADKSDSAQNTPPADTPSQNLPGDSQNDSTLGQNSNCGSDGNSNSDASNNSGSTLENASSIVKPGKDQIIIQTVKKEY